MKYGKGMKWYHYSPIQVSKSEGGRFLTLFWLVGCGYQFKREDCSCALTIKLWKLHTFVSVAIF